LLLTSLLVAAGMAAGAPPVDNVAGVRLGDSEAAARRRIRRYGAVARQVADDGAVTLTAGAAAATLCRDEVVSMVLVIGHGFHDFARAGAHFLKTRGPALSPELYAIAPAGSAAGAAVGTDIVRLKWAEAPAFSLAYSEAGDTHQVFVALNAPNPCGRSGEEGLPAEPQQ